jgi:beta-phosphoglucomutase-like phosphatase (HAD superfamily)
MKKAIIFDMDGVLIDSEIIYQEWMFQFLRSHEVVYPVRNYQQKIGTTQSVFDDLEMYNKGINIINLKKQFEDYWISRKLDFSSIFPMSLKEQLKWFKNTGFSLAIASSSPLETIKDMTKSCDIQSYFNYIISGRSLVESKPHPEIFLRAAEGLGVLPSECFVVEDSHHGVLAGKSAGMEVIAIADKRFNQDLSDADYLIESIGSLKEVIKERQKN